MYSLVVKSGFADPKSWPLRRVQATCPTVLSSGNISGLTYHLAGPCGSSARFPLCRLLGWHLPLPPLVIATFCLNEFLSLSPPWQSQPVVIYVAQTMALKIHNCKFVVFNSEAYRIVISASQIQIQLLGYSMKKIQSPPSIHSLINIWWVSTMSQALLLQGL